MGNAGYKIQGRDAVIDARQVKVELRGKGVLTIAFKNLDEHRLAKLFLFRNQLTSLPAEIGMLTCLTQLYLGENRLKVVPAEIGRLTGLTHLWLHSNELTSLPEEIGKVSDLTVLWLQNNRLTSLPEEIRDLTSLRCLNLNNNKLVSPSVEIGKLSDCGRLQLFINGKAISPSRLAPNSPTALRNNPPPASEPHEIEMPDSRLVDDPALRISIEFDYHSTAFTGKTGL